MRSMTTRLLSSFFSIVLVFSISISFVDAKKRIQLSSASVPKKIKTRKFVKNLNEIFKNPASHVAIMPYDNPVGAPLIKPLTSLYQSEKKELRFVFIVPGYNNALWYKKNLESIFMQNYCNYHIIYIDDASTDGTDRLVQDFVKEWGMESRFTLIKNKERKYMAYNRYMAVHLCADTDICIALDGDDWLAHDQVLTYYNKVYQDKNVWMTYGSYTCFPSGDQGRVCARLPDKVIQKNSIRQNRWTASHLKTFYAWLFKLIPVECFKYKDTFFTGSTDLAMMYPMLEMAHFYSKFVSQKTYVYNCLDQRIQSASIESLKAHRKKMGDYLRAQKPFQPIKINDV
ncbi:glycosyltransferase family 2 protein [Candidatus Dependentiae bacterium]|nr:glycosyltransferase family 2 protein [Candidatus Dependentiae bacterium]